MNFWMVTVMSNEFKEWIAPYCNKCAKKMPYKMIDINEWFEDGE